MNALLRKSLFVFQIVIAATVIVALGMPWEARASGSVLIAADEPNNSSGGMSTDTNSQPSSRGVSDSEITAKVKAALLADDQVKGSNIKVKTSKGQVVLSGVVETPSQSQRAIQVAKNVEGVKKVRNKLTVNNLELNPNNPSKNYRNGD